MTSAMDAMWAGGIEAVAEELTLHAWKTRDVRQAAAQVIAVFANVAIPGGIEALRALVGGEMELRPKDIGAELLAKVEADEATAPDGGQCW